LRHHAALQKEKQKQTSNRKTKKLTKINQFAVSLFYLEDGSIRFLRNVVNFMPDYKALHSRRQYSAYSYT
jgi:hypothetical protein